MGRAIEIIVILVLLIASFLFGVKYSDSVKEQASWVFEDEIGEDVKIPALPNGSVANDEKVVPVEGPVASNGAPVIVNNPNEAQNPALNNVQNGAPANLQQQTLQPQNGVPSPSQLPAKAAPVNINNGNIVVAPAVPANNGQNGQVVAPNAVQPSPAPVQQAPASAQQAPAIVQPQIPAAIPQPPTLKQPNSN